jgi:hypothetical protein
LPHVTIDAIEQSDSQFPGSDLSNHIAEHQETWAKLVDVTPMDTVMKELEDEGVAAFEKSYQSCLDSISTRLAEL